MKYIRLASWKNNFQFHSTDIISPTTDAGQRKMNNVQRLRYTAATSRILFRCFEEVVPASFDFADFEGIGCYRYWRLE
jgi:hypothetical protein